MSEIPYKIYLKESEMPTQWYNVRADMKKKPAPILNPGTPRSHPLSLTMTKLRTFRHSLDV